MATLYGIRSGDTLECIAQLFYGDPGRWPQIAEENDLLPPYISENPRDRYGKPVATLAVENPVEEGSYTAAFPSFDGTDVFMPGYRAYFEDIDISGEKLTTLQEVKDYDGRRVEFYDPFPRAYPEGSLVLVFAPVYAHSARCVGPGDVIRIPGAVAPMAGPGPGQSVLSLAEWNEAVGIDAALAEDGTLVWDEAMRDLSTLLGMDNVRQFITGRLVTELGILDHHPDYGSELGFLLGYKNTPGLATMAAAYAREAVERDPRVARAEDVEATVAEDCLSISMTVYVARTGAIYRVENTTFRWEDL